MPEIKVDVERCKGCELCIINCPKKILVFSEDFNEKGYYYPECPDPENCTACASPPSCIADVKRATSPAPSAVADSRPTLINRVSCCSVRLASPLSQPRHTRQAATMAGVLLDIRTVLSPRTSDPCGTCRTMPRCEPPWQSDC